MQDNCVAINWKTVMTTYSSSFVLEGEEVLIYRHLLEIWAATAKGESLNRIDNLIHRTFDLSGGNALRVEEYVRLEIIFPLWKIMAAELERITLLQKKNRELPRGKRDINLTRHFYLLEQVIDKVKNTEMSSTYVPPKKD